VQRERSRARPGARRSSFRRPLAAGEVNLQPGASLSARRADDLTASASGASRRCGGPAHVLRARASYRRRR
jgi:hypothetical protein